MKNTLVVIFECQHYCIFCEFKDLGESINLFFTNVSPFDAFFVNIFNVEIGRIYIFAPASP